MSLIAADQIGKLKINEKEVSILVKDQLTQITALIVNHPQKLGINYVIYDLPRHNFTGASLADSQRMIAAKLIKEIKEKNYKVRIILDNSNPKLLIKWTTAINRDDIDIMNAYIKENKIDSAEIEEFLNEN